MIIESFVDEIKLTPIAEEVLKKRYLARNYRDQTHENQILSACSFKRDECNLKQILPEDSIVTNFTLSLYHSKIFSMN